MIKKSKFRSWNGFMQEAKGRIAIQHHGEEVWYRNIRVRGNKQKPLRAVRAPIYKCRMNSVRHFFVATCLLAAGLWAGEHNTLSKAEKAAGWQLLFDGKNINKHWRNIGQKEVTGAGWVSRTVC